MITFGGGGLVRNSLLECNLFTVSTLIFVPKHFNKSECCSKKTTFLITMNVFVDMYLIAGSSFSL